jgi:hypothetical protein
MDKNGLSRLGKPLAKTAWSANRIIVSFFETLSDSSAAELACLLLLDEMYAAREDLFSRQKA